MGNVRKLLTTLVGTLGLNLVLSVAPTWAESPVLLGAYTSGWLDATVSELQEIDTWIGTPGRRLAFGGEFISLHPPYSVPAVVPSRLEAAWSRGYVPFVNLEVDIPAGLVAAGAIDGQIRTWAATFATWAGTTKRAILVPLAEMNVETSDWHDTPANFKGAYARIRQLFAQEMAARGVPATAVLWVFGPNGRSNPGKNFELYYPGEATVDAVGLSVFNFGVCENPPSWQPYSVSIKPFLDRARTMAPGKPLMLSQTGVIDSPTLGGFKDAWLADTYTQLVGYRSLRAVVYYNKNLPPCDWRVRLPGTTQWAGFRNTVISSTLNYGYHAPSSTQMINTVFAPTPSRVFADVTPYHPWAVDDDVRNYAPFIHALYFSGFTSGCVANPLQYCPTASVTRAQMAVFLVRGIHGLDYPLPPATGVFADVPTNHWAAPWIEQLWRDGITGGCYTNPLRYCPDSPVTRAEMSVFMLRSIHGAAYAPPPATGLVFTDVPASYWAAAWIERLYSVNQVSTSCPPPNPVTKYCPDSALTRDEMAIFLVRGFHL
jgi:hypothetical protein